MLGKNASSNCHLLACILTLFLCQGISTARGQDRSDQPAIPANQETKRFEPDRTTEVTPISPLILKRVAVQGFAVGVLGTLTVGLGVAFSLILFTGRDDAQPESVASSQERTTVQVDSDQRESRIAEPERRPIKDVALPTLKTPRPVAATLPSDNRPNGGLFQQIMCLNLQLRGASSSDVVS